MNRPAVLGFAGLFVWVVYATGLPWLSRYVVSTTACETWDGSLVARPFHKQGKYAYVADVPMDRDVSDDNEHPHRSPALLCEDGKPIGRAHAMHAEIRDDGGGLYSLWSGTLYFSSSDNTDADANGRRYRLIFPPLWYRVLPAR